MFNEICINEEMLPIYIDNEYAEEKQYQYFYHRNVFMEAHMT